MYDVMKIQRIGEVVERSQEGKEKDNAIAKRVNKVCVLIVFYLIFFSGIR